MTDGQTDVFGGEGREVDEQPFGGWVKPQDQGEAVIGYVRALKENENGRYLVMERRDGARFNFPVPTHVDQNFPVHEFVGRVMGFAWTGTQDVGGPSPMHTYTVRDFGDAYPDARGIEANADLS